MHALPPERCFAAAAASARAKGQPALPLSPCLSRLAADRWGRAMGYSFPATDDLLVTLTPILVYWGYAGVYTLVESCEKYRLHAKRDEQAKNLVSRRTVVKAVLLQQAVQAIVSLALLWLTKEEGGAPMKQQQQQRSSLPRTTVQFLVAMAVLDTWQYFVHRYMHANEFLYRHVHSRHHAVVVPYAVGAMYNHPVEGFAMDTAGGALAFLVSGMTPRTAMLFFSVATMKTVDDHCGMCLPWNPFQRLFANNSAYHDVHHQLYGGRHNFSQPFFVAWDMLLGTYMPYTLVKAPGGGGGFEARPARA